MSDANKTLESVLGNTPVQLAPAVAANPMDEAKALILQANEEIIRLRNEVNGWQESWAHERNTIMHLKVRLDWFQYAAEAMMASWIFHLLPRHWRLQIIAMATPLAD